MPRQIDPQEAAEVMRRAGVEPLEPYPGARVGWRVRCLTCGSENRPHYSSVKKGTGACNSCARRVTAEKQRVAGYETSRTKLRESGWDLLTSLEDYRSQKRPVEVRCLRCLNTRSGVPDSLKLAACNCQKSARRPLERDFPALAEQLHPTKNVAVPLDKIGSGTRSNVWWICSLGHEFQASPANRVRGSGCTFCANQAVWPGFNDLASQNPELAADWHPRNELKPSEVTTGANRRVWWKCSVDDRHEYQATVANRSNGTGCAVCAGKVVVSGVNDLASQRPGIAAEWHPTKNGASSSSSTFATTLKKVWWLCETNPRHEWAATVSSRVRLGAGCPYCAGQKVVPGEGDLASSSPALMAQWHPELNEGIDPSLLPAGSGRMIWWICDVHPGHVWRRSPAGRTWFDSGCPYCSNTKLLAGWNDLETVDPVLSEQFDLDLNYPLKPSEIQAGSHRAVWWRCSAFSEHTWKVSPANRAKSGCPECGQYGYSSARAGFFYFLVNQLWRTAKVGITNQNTTGDRLGALEKLGFRRIKVWSHSNGQVLRELEAVALHRIRKELGLPPHVGKEEMGFVAGWTETFSSDAVDHVEFTLWLDGEFARIVEASPELE